MQILNAKGTKDFLPEEKIIRQKIVDQLREIFELYGYSPLETPCLERMDVLAAKYAGGAEILKETFQLRDQGDRQLGLKYDLTVPFCRVIAMNPQLRMPFKRYQIERVFRDGPIKLGRMREFWQCDVDVAGCKSMLVDAEMVAIASDFFRKIGLKVVIRVNNRKVLDAMMDEAGVDESKRESAILTLDKLEKVGEAGVKEEFAKKGIAGDQLLDLVKQKTLSLKDDEGLNELKELEDFLKLFGVTNYKIDYTLARGLSYYTGTVFEVQCREIDSSVAGGGRYDKMIGGFLGKGEVPAVGISFGLEPIYEILKSKEKVRKTVTEVYVIPIKCFNESLKIVKDLRGFGVKCDIDLKGKSISKNLDYVNKMGIPYALIVGEDELKVSKFSLKDMEKGSEEKLSVPGIVKKLK
tara:strand:+ start:486 stop:1712 length:1227 start_codon:yes stop_codon:yes gene_type:complete